MNRLQKSAQPLLETPPRPAPTMEDLQRRADRRRDDRRRARLTILSVAVVALLAGGALVARQDRDLETLTGPPGTTFGTVSTTTPAASTTVSTRPPPPLEAEPVELTVDPASAPAATNRQLTITNHGTRTYFTCFGFKLRRWTGEGWTDVAVLWVANADRGPITYLERLGTETDCSSAPVAAGQNVVRAFDPGHLTIFPSSTDNGLPSELQPGLYELFDSQARGRFEITSTIAATPGTGVNHGVQVGKTTVGLNPGTTLERIHEVLPTELMAVDDDTISLAWTGACNTPADHVEIEATAGEVNVRLAIGSFVVRDCTGDPDHWVATFDLPFAIAGRPITTRAVTETGTTMGGPFMAAPDGSDPKPAYAEGSFTTSGPTEVTSMLLSRELVTGAVRGRLHAGSCWGEMKAPVFRTAANVLVPQPFARGSSSDLAQCVAGPPVMTFGELDTTVFGAPAP
jgi:hypothetical protein